MHAAVRLTFVALLLACAADVAHAEKIAWQTDIATASKIAAEKDLPLVVFLTSSHCPYCVKMRSTTLVDESIATELNRRFVPVYVDRGTHPEFERRIGVRLYPTTVILRADQAELLRLSGYVAPQQFAASLERAAAQHVAAKSTIVK